MIQSCLRDASLREWCGRPDQHRKYQYLFHEDSDSDLEAEIEITLREVSIQIRDGHRAELSALFQDDTIETTTFSLFQREVLPTPIHLETFLQKRMISLWKEMTHLCIFTIYILYGLQRAIQIPLFKLMQEVFCIFLLHLTLVHGVFHQI